jgi:serine O-acetyltransferase
VANAINRMLDHIHAMDERLEEMCKGMKALGAEISELNLPDLGPCELGSTAPTQPLEPEPAEPDGPSEKGRPNS